MLSYTKSAYQRAYLNIINVNKDGALNEFVYHLKLNYGPQSNLPCEKLIDKQIL